MPSFLTPQFISNHLDVLEWVGIHFYMYQLFALHEQQHYLCLSCEGRRGCAAGLIAGHASQSVSRRVGADFVGSVPGLKTRRLRVGVVNVQRSLTQV